MMPSPSLNRIQILKQSFQMKGNTVLKNVACVQPTLNRGWAGTQAKKRRLFHNSVVKPAFLIMMRSLKTVNYQK